MFRRLPGASAARRTCVAAAALSGSLAVLATAPASAGIIISADPSFFDGQPLVGGSEPITFAQAGNGSAVSLVNGDSLAMPATEYSARGVVFSPAVRWVNDGNASFDAAQNTANSLSGVPLDEIAIPGAAVDNFTMTFNTVVRGVGFWLIMNSGDSTIPTFTARDQFNNVLDTGSFTGAAIQQTGVARYAFVTIFADGESPNIASVEVTKDQAILDNLYISPLPAPGAVALLGLGGLAAMRRRRAVAAG